MAILHMDAAMYEKTLRESDKMVLVTFSAPWCGDCRRLEPALEQAAEEYGSDLLFGKVIIDEEKELAAQAGIKRIPTLVMYRGGQPLGSIVEPASRAELDAFIGAHLKREKAEEGENGTVHDMIVVGGGPGGYTAALYAARAGMDVAVLEKMSAGGQMALTHQIDNYPGFEEGVDGFTLGEKMRMGAERFGVKTVMTEATALHLNGPVKRVQTTEGAMMARTVVIATGADPRELGVAREKEMTGRGVSYCANCDGMFYRNQTVVVVGGGNSAAADALILARLCKKVMLVHRRDTLRATKIYHDPLLHAENVEFRWNSVVSALQGDEQITGVTLTDVQTGEKTAVDCDGVFISVGRKPATGLVQGQLTLDAAGYILADESTRTNIPGVFAVGDVRTKALRQVVTAVSDGATAVHYAEEYLAEQI